MTERRYSQDEASAIFARATEAEQGGQRPMPRGEGMTLADLQEIGREVGIPSELVAHAARSLDQRARPVGRRLLGLPLQVGLNVTLGRALTDPEWERLVVDLRSTFDARGVVRQDGSLRQWTNGNLQVMLEPVDEGQRVRFRTTNGNARTFIAAGVGTLVAGALTVLTAIGGAGLAEPGKLVSAGFIALFGAALVGVGALRLPGWARVRRRQMEEVAERLVRRIHGDIAS